MTTPNKLTVLRVVLVPVFFVWFQFAGMVSPLVYTVVLALIYATAELTDLFDGKIARKYNLVTDLGKVMDPFADVMSHLTYFTCLLSCSLLPVWAFAVILWREFSQSFLRLLLMGKGKPMAANIFGKAKTCFYAAVSICGFATHCAGLFGYKEDWMIRVMTVLGAVAAVVSALSFLIYVANVRREGTLRNLTR